MIRPPPTRPAAALPPPTAAAADPEYRFQFFCHTSMRIRLAFNLPICLALWTIHFYGRLENAVVAASVGDEPRTPSCKPAVSCLAITSCSCNSLDDIVINFVQCGETKCLSRSRTRSIGRRNRKSIMTQWLCSASFYIAGTCRYSTGTITIHPAHHLEFFSARNASGSNRTSSLSQNPCAILQGH